MSINILIKKYNRAVEKAGKNSYMAKTIAQDICDEYIKIQPQVDEAFMFCINHGFNYNK